MYWICSSEYTLFQKSAHDITIRFQLFRKHILWKLINKPSKQNCFLPVYVGCKMIAGCWVYQGRVGKSLFWWKFKEKRTFRNVQLGYRPGNLLKNKNAFANLHEFGRWDYQNVLSLSKECLKFFPHPFILPKLWVLIPMWMNFKLS